VSPKTFMDVIIEDMRSHPMSQWLDCFVSIHAFATRYLDENTSLVLAFRYC
jgi:hypothetical protein